MISFNDKAYIFLSSLELAYKKFSDIVSHYSQAGEVIQALQDGGDLFLKEEFHNNFEKYKKALSDFSFENLENYFQKNNVNYITIEHENYPAKLLQLDQPPLILYYKGDINLINTKCISIVGTRKPSFYGKDVTAKFAKELSQAGFTVVSGLAMGVDKVAHESTLKENGKTIAVLGNGFERMYPAMNVNLAKEIADKGLIITEYYPTFNACAYSFPARNRIIAALSCGVLITEAANKSGSLYTKDFALELGKDVFCVPGNINNINSEATNNIIKNGHGACVTCTDDILSVYGIKLEKKKEIKIQLNFDEQKIFDFLKTGEKSFDDLQIYTNLSVQNLNTYLTTLQISGIIKKLPGNMYSA